MTDEIIYLDAAEEAQFTIRRVQSQTEDRPFHDKQVPAARASEAVTADPKDIQFMDVAPAQIVSVATALIPFLGTTTRTAR